MLSYPPRIENLNRVDQSYWKAATEFTVGGVRCCWRMLANAQLEGLRAVGIETLETDQSK